jgi:hypothetical protein
METPAKMGANEILKKHGPAGWLVRKLQRYAMLGWLLFFILLGVQFIERLVKILASQPVVAVDAGGKVLGTFEYLKPSTRSEEEIKAAAMRFANNYLSLNSATIFEDFSEAMNMMGPEMMKEAQETINKDNYLARVARARTRSWLEFAPNDGVTIVDQRNLEAKVRMRGNIVVEGESKVVKPFDITVETQAVARSTNNTSGLKILSRKDN